MLVSVIGLWLQPSEDVLASVLCSSAVDFSEENRIRTMIHSFYAKTTPSFARLAVEVNGKILSFRAVKNCKRPPNNEEVIAVLKAIGYYPRETIKKSHIKVRHVAGLHEASHA